MSSQRSSVFSVESTSSCSSLCTPDFIDELLHEFITDQQLLVSAGLVWKRKPGDFTFICSNSIRSYSHKLRKEADTALQRSAAKLVRRQVVFLAEGIRSYFDKTHKLPTSSDRLHQIEQRLAVLDKSSTIEKDDHEIDDDNEYPRVEKVKDFLLRGWPFSDLIKTLVASARKKDKPLPTEGPSILEDGGTKTITTRHCQLSAPLHCDSPKCSPKFGQTNQANTVIQLSQIKGPDAGFEIQPSTSLQDGTAFPGQQGKASC